MDFIEALSTDNLTSIRAAPKTDVHSHAFLSTRLEHLERWLGQPLKHPPSKMEGLAGMMEYINEVLSHHIITPESFKFVASSGVRDAIQDGVVVLEVKAPKPKGLGLCFVAVSLPRKDLHLLHRGTQGSPQNVYRSVDVSIMV